MSSDYVQRLQAPALRPGQLAPGSGEGQSLSLGLGAREGVQSSERLPGSAREPARVRRPGSPSLVPTQAKKRFMSNTSRFLSMK